MPLTPPCNSLLAQSQDFISMVLLQQHVLHKTPTFDSELGFFELGQNAGYGPLLQI